MKGPATLLLERRRRRFAGYLRSLVSLARRKDLVFFPKLIERPECRRGLVLSPHCDDDVIGLGGLLHRLARDRDSLTILYFAGTSTSEGEGAGSIGARRREEAQKATAILGIEAPDLVFLDQPDGGLCPSPELIDRLVRILAEKSPEVVYLPWFLENHVDHVAVNAVFGEAWGRWRSPCTVYAYEVWTPLFPNRIVDITPDVEIKKKALSQYASQLDRVDYVGTTLALNRYRSVTNLKGRGFAEAFLCLGVREYLDLFSRWFRDPFIQHLFGSRRSP